MILYTDKNQTIYCSLSIQGGDVTSQQDTKLRLNLKCDDCCCFFEGEHIQNQDWKINIPALKKYSPGTCSLDIEVMVGGYYFQVHQQEVEIKTQVPVVDFKIGDSTSQQTTKISTSTEKPTIKLDIKYDEDIPTMPKTSNDYQTKVEPLNTLASILNDITMTSESKNMVKENLEQKPKKKEKPKGIIPFETFIKE